MLVIAFGRFMLHCGSRYCSCLILIPIQLKADILSKAIAHVSTATSDVLSNDVEASLILILSSLSTPTLKLTCLTSYWTALVKALSTKEILIRRVQLQSVDVDVKMKCINFFLELTSGWRCKTWTPSSTTVLFLGGNHQLTNSRILKALLTTFENDKDDESKIDVGVDVDKEEWRVEVFFRYYMLFLLSQIITSAKILLTPWNTDQNTNQGVPVYGISIPIPAKLPV